jgi:broad specificity phosphatase PhoE
MELMQVERVYIVRHGETDYNATGRWQGALDISLNELGRQQAAHLAQYLQAQSETIDCVYTSDLTRARQTAEIIAQAYGLEALHDVRLRETRVGIFEGLTNSEIDEQYPQARQQWTEDMDYCVPQGESRNQVQRRMLEAWQEWTEHLPLRHVMIVSHGVAIRLLLQAIAPHYDHTTYRLHNTSLTVLQRTASGWVLDRVGSVTHLPVTNTPS